MHYSKLHTNHLHLAITPKITILKKSTNQPTIFYPYQVAIQNHLHLATTPKITILKKLSTQ